MSSLQISIEGTRGPSFEGDIAVDSISFTPGRCLTIVSEEEIQADSHLGLGENSKTDIPLDCLFYVDQVVSHKRVRRVWLCSTGKP